MFVSFGRTLRRGFGLRLGFRMRGWSAVFVALFAAMFYTIWWTLLGCGYICWGLCWATWQSCRGLWYLVKTPLKRLYIRIKDKRPRA